MNILEILESKGIDYIAKGQNEFAITCPAQSQHQDACDSTPSFSINVEKNKAHCFSCGLSMDETGLAKFLLGEDLDEISLSCLELKGKLKQIESSSYDLSLPLPASGDIIFPPGELWSEDYRGISKETYRKLLAVRVTRGWYSDRIAFPVCVNNRLVGVDARTLLPDVEPRYLRNKGSSCKTNWLYPYDLAREYKIKKVILNEGIFHSINVFDKLGMPEGQTIFGCKNWSLEKFTLLLALGIEEVVLFPDKDKAGEKAMLAIGSEIRDWIKVTIADTEKLPVDPAASLKKGKIVFSDLGDISAELIHHCLDNRRPFK